MMDDVADEANIGSEAEVAVDPATVFAALAEIIYQGSDTTQMYAAICVAATLIVPGCDHASLLVRRDDRYVTVGASDSSRTRSTISNDAPVTAPASTPSKKKRRRSNRT